MTSRRRRLLRAALLWVVPALAVAGAGAYYLAHLHYASTDNAYVKSDKVIVSPQVDGCVTEVLVAENQRVRAGEPLVKLDEATLRLAVERARADLAATRTTIASLQAQFAEKSAELDVARRDLEFARRDAERQEQLVTHRLVAQSRVDEAGRALALASGRITVVEREVAQIAARLGPALDGGTDAHPEVNAARATLARTELDLARTTLVAPRDGIVSHLPQPGDRVQTDRPALAIVADRGVWIEANFKETDLADVQVGQAAAIRVDAYGARQWTGRVESIAHATGAEFAILPPQNATGNWVKVVQRVPVRIALDVTERDPPLRAGMSAYVEVDTRSAARPAKLAASP